MKFINPKRSIKQSTLITNLSDDNRFVSSGAAKSSSINSMSWLSDNLFKVPGNTFINPNATYVSFFNDSDIIYQSLINIPEMYNAYSFLQYYQPLKFSD